MSEVVGEMQDQNFYGMSDIKIEKIIKMKFQRNI
jgi:hypothetical protein